ELRLLQANDIGLALLQPRQQARQTLLDRVDVPGRDSHEPDATWACDPTSMQSSNVEITTPDGVADAFLARPDDQRHPGVLFIMDAYGLRPTIEEMVERIAADGYVVLEPNVFYRAGRSPVGPMPEMSDPEQRTRFFQSIRPLIEELTPERIASDGAAYLDYLGEVEAPAPVAITGYCMGARLGWR